jgi:hypothetical protein
VFRGWEEPSLVAEDLFRKEPRTRRRPVDALVTPDSFSHEIGNKQCSPDPYNGFLFHFFLHVHVNLIRASLLSPY